MSDLDFRRTAVDGTLARLKSSCEGIAATSEAAVKGIQHFRGLMSQHSKEMASRESRLARDHGVLVGLCRSVLIAARSGSPTKLEKSCARLESAISVEGKKVMVAGPDEIRRAIDFLRKLAAQGSYRNIEFVEGQRMTTRIVWQGGDQYHPTTLAEFALKWLLDEGPADTSSSEFED